MDYRDFEVWERRDVPTLSGPYSSWTRGQLARIEQGFDPHLLEMGYELRDTVNEPEDTFTGERVRS